jgi:hypothetical protein
VAVVTVIIVAVVVVAILVIAGLAWQTQRRRNLLQDRFGPEYDRTVESSDSRKAAEQELAQRAERRDELEIRELSPQEATRYREDWFGIQQRFVDAPGEAVTAARSLVASAMRDRGYPTDSTDERETMLSVDHGDVVQCYREAVGIEERGQTNGVTTEDLRQAMQLYRTVFDRVVGEPPAVIDVTDSGSAYDGTEEPPPPPATNRSRANGRAGSSRRTASAGSAGRVSARRGSPADPAG